MVATKAETAKWRREVQQREALLNDLEEKVKEEEGYRAQLELDGVEAPQRVQCFINSTVCKLGAL